MSIVALETETVRRWKRYPEYRQAISRHSETRRLESSTLIQDSLVQYWGHIPAHWKMTKLRHLVPDHRPIMYGIVLPGPHVDDGIPIVKGGNCEPGRLRLDLLSRTSREIEAGYERSRLREGDIVYAIRGSIGAADIVPAELNGANLTQDAARIALKPGIHPRWLLYTVRAAPFFAKLDAGAIGATIRGINIRDLKRADLPLPPLSEQRVIAAFLDRETARIDALIDRKERLIALLEEKRQAVISHAVTRGLDPTVPLKDSGVPWLGMVPKHWKQILFKYCATIPNGQVDPTLAQYRDLTLIAPNHIEAKTGRLLGTETAREQEASSGKYVIRPGDVVYSKIRPELQKAIVSHIHGLCSADMYPLRPTWRVRSEYLLHYILSPQFTQFATLTSERVAMPKINREDLFNCVVVLPPLNEQSEIVACLHNHSAQMDRIIRPIRDSITGLQEYRTALISAAVTGQIDVRGEVKL